MWLLKTHSREKRMADNYVPLSCLIGVWERSLRSSFRTSDLAPQCFRHLSVCGCGEGYERGFTGSLT